MRTPTLLRSLPVDSLAVMAKIPTGLRVEEATLRDREALAQLMTERALRAPVKTSDPAALAAYAKHLRPAVTTLRTLAEDATAALRKSACVLDRGERPRAPCPGTLGA